MKGIYTVYSKEDDMTFIMNEQPGRLEVVGFYFGSPEDDLTKKYAGKTYAEASIFGTDFEEEETDFCYYLADNLMSHFSKEELKGKSGKDILEYAKRMAEESDERTKEYYDMQLRLLEEDPKRDELCEFISRIISEESNWDEGNADQIWAQNESLTKQNKKKKQVIPGNAADGITLFNQALGNGEASESMNEDWMLPSDWIRKEFPGYSIEELEEACQALRLDFVSDSEFLHDYAFYSDKFSGNEVDLMDEREATEFVEDNLIEVALTVDRDFVEKYLEDHFTPMNEGLYDRLENKKKWDSHFNKMLRNGACPHCGSNSLEFVGNDHDFVVCDDCGAEMWADEQPGGGFKFMDIEDEESAGAYDDFLTDLGGYTDYNGRIDALMDEFGLSREEAKKEVWSWSIHQKSYYGESLRESYLTEDESEEVGVDDIDIDPDAAQEQPAADDLTFDEIEDQEDQDVNEVSKKSIVFPILIEGFDSENNPISMDEQEEENFASEFGDAVVSNIEDNKKFILSALNIYDMEVYYDSYDSNSHVKFIVTTDEPVDSSSLMNVLKRYFNTDIESKTTDSGEFTLTPVLDNKFIRVVD